nr:MAG TPA: hypothetical protein [Caudoviricetes sp.]
MQWQGKTRLGKEVQSPELLRQSIDTTCAAKAWH